MEKRVILSSQRDLPLLQFLWTWKLAPSAVLAARFFPEASANRAYNRLNALERARYIHGRTDEHGQSHVWMLTKKGYTAVRDKLPPLKEEGFRSESIRHDLI